MKTLKKIPITYKKVDKLPDLDAIKDNTLYLCAEGYATHKCLCGCGYLVMLPLQPLHPGGWWLTEEEGSITVTPSILNHPCKAHYIITDSVANLV